MVKVDIVALVTVAILVLYIIYTGGDFMEFRPFVPIIPLIAALGIGTIRNAHPALIWPMVIALAVLSVLNATHFYVVGRERGGIESVFQLQGHVMLPESNWAGIGKKLNEVFYKDEAGGGLPKIAVNPAGAIPFYARLPSYDLHGLTSPEVARHGLEYVEKPGHEHLATPAQIREADVDIYVGTAKLLQVASLAKTDFTRETVAEMFCPSQRFSSRLFQEWCDDLLYGPRVLIIPIDDQYRLVALLLRDNDIVRDRIAKGVVSIRDIGP
jgi:hypothetical protein